MRQSWEVRRKNRILFEKQDFEKKYLPLIMDPGPGIKNAGHADRPIRFQAEAQWQSSVVCFSCGSVRGHSLGKMKSTEELQEKNRLNGSPVCVWLGK